MTAGLKVDGFFAGPPTTLSLKLSAPMLIPSASQATTCRGKESNGIEYAEVLTVCSPGNLLKESTTDGDTRELWKSERIATNGEIAKSALWDIT